MPQKGSKSPADNENASNHGESGLTSFDEVAAKLSSEFDSKFGRLESALEAKLDAIAAVVPNAGSQHRGEKRPFVPNYEPHDTRSKAARKDSLSQSAGPSRQFNFINPENNMSGQQMSSGASYSADAMDHSLRPQFTASDGSAAMFSSSGNNNMEAWLTERAQTLAANSTALPLSSRDFSSNMTLDSQISQILATTAHQLSTGNQPSGVFLFKYVRRASDKPRPVANTLTMQEHLWGITCIIRDEAVPQDIKPYLYIHLEEI